MSLTQSDIEVKLNNLLPFLVNEYGVKRIGYFGSYATGMQDDESDIDILVEFSQPCGWKFFTLEKLLEDHLGKEVDLVTASAIKTQLKDSILKQVKFI
jgi:predicted nucleotidyltransferase